jgi:hypothetical protein
VTALEKIDQAFLQLSFSIKIMAYIELGRVSKDDLDQEMHVRLPRKDLILKKDMFNTPDDIILAAQNAYVITLGFSAIALDTILDESGFTRAAAPDNVRDLRDLIYMVRCAFAHDMMHPQWVARGPFARTLRVYLPHWTIVVDAAALNGKVFDLDQIGGAGAYFEMKDRIKRLLAQNQ